MNLSEVRALILHPNELNDQSVQSLFKIINKNKVDHSDIYFQNYAYESWSLENNIIKEGNYGVDLGVGIRAVLGDQVAFSYSNDLNIRSLEVCADRVKSISNLNKDIIIPNISKKPNKTYYNSKCPISSEKSEDKISLMHFINDYIKRPLTLELLFPNKLFVCGIDLDCNLSKAVCNEAI